MSLARRELSVHCSPVNTEPEVMHMRMIDPIADKEVKVIQVYLTRDDALFLKQRMDMLLENPEAEEHFHLCNDASHDLSFSIVTPTKLARRGYTELEQQVLADMMDT
jgi:hypothetical protein